MSMTDTKQQGIASQILTGNFTKAGPAVTQLSDPLVDTPMVVTIDELKPYELNPRLVENPLFEDIKASIRERGLDAPPAITRRPGESHFIIRNGGNTRLRILHELWKETRDERFFRIHCLFRPWTNEITALTGHLAENELHGQLTFIERAIAIGKLHEMYQSEYQVTLNQKQLSQKLVMEGYPISEAQISRMREAVNYLLPVIPNALYGGLSRNQVDKLLRFRKVAKNTWKKYEPSAIEAINSTFDDLFMDVLSMFDVPPEQIEFGKLRDELVGRMAQILSCSYETIGLDVSEKEARQRLLESPPASSMEIDEAQLFSKPVAPASRSSLNEEDILALPLAPVYKEPAIKVTRTRIEPDAPDYALSKAVDTPTVASEEDQQALVDAHIVSPVESTPRLDAIEGMIGELTGDEAQDFKTNVIKAVPVQAGGLYPVADIWHINASLDSVEQLRVHIGQLVLEIADEWQLAECIETTQIGLGFEFHEPSQPPVDAATEFLSSLLESLAHPDECYELRSDYLNAILTGSIADVDVLSDVAFVKLMRVYRLLRRYWQLQRN